MVYFDGAASSRRSEEFVDQYRRWLARPIDNSLRLSILRRTISKIAVLLGVEVDSISLVPNASYGLNEIASYLSSKYGDRTVYISTSEHAANHVPWLKHFPNRVDYFNMGDFCDWNPKDEPCIISLSPITNLEGMEVSMEEVEKRAGGENIVVVDGTQLIPRRYSDLSRSKIDFLVFSAHKFFGPNGIGFVYSRVPCGIGMGFGDFGEKNEDYTLDYAGLGAWNNSFNEIAGMVVTGHMESQLELLGKYFMDNFPKNNFIRLVEGNPSVSIFLLEITHPIITAHDYSFYLWRRGVIVRSGLSCSHISGEKYDAQKIIRVSLDHKNTIEEIDYFLGLVENFEELDCF